MISANTQKKSIFLPICRHVKINPYFKMLLSYWSTFKFGTIFFSKFSCMFLNPIFFSNLNYNCFNLLNMRNLQEQVKKAFFYQKLFWTFTVWINQVISKFLKILGLQHLIFKGFSRSLKQFFRAVGQNNFGNKIPFLLCLR